MNLLRHSLALALLAASVAAQSPARFVGFTSHWSLDPARSYDTSFADGSRYASGGLAPRPILVNVWYPAVPAKEAVPMRRGDYLDVHTDDPRLAPFAKALEAYARGVVAQELLHVDPDKRTPEDEAALAEALAGPTSAVRDAPAAGGRRPLVIYHAGYGSSYEDNAACCERLAAHGYVVAGSAFQAADGASFNIDSHDGSLRDLDFLLRELCARPDVDPSRLALAGHSGGAHTLFRAQARPQSPWRALIVLDTTQDYWSAREPRWTHSADVLAAPERFDVPMLVAADREAIFDLVDRLAGADRWYLTFRQLSHNSFIEQGVLTDDVAARRATGEDAAEVKEDARIEREGFDRVCSTAATFLDAALKGDAAARAALEALAGSTPPGDVPWRLEHTPVGATGPTPWDPASDAPPEPRQLRGALAALGAPELVKRLDGWHAAQPQLPIFAMWFGLSLSWDLVESGRLDEARVLAPFYGRITPSTGSVGVWLAGMAGARPGMSEWKGQMLQACVLCNPDDAEVKAAWEAWEKR